MRRVARASAAAAAAAAAALHVGAAAADSSVAVEGRGAATELEVGFTLKAVDGKVARVKRFKFEGLLLRCDQGDVILDNLGNPFPSMKVKDKEFEGRFETKNSAGIVVHDVAGRITKRGKMASGNLRARGTFVDGGGDSATNCDSGKTRWAEEKD